MSRPVILILGAGSRLGAGIAAAFSSADYSVAVVSRSNPSPPSPDPSTSHLRIRADLAVPSQVVDAFAAVKSHFGKPPRVVVYNASTFALPPDADNLLSLDVEQFEHDVKVNATGAYVAAQQAVEAWKEDGEAAGRFLFTGNLLNGKPMPVPIYFTGGASKSQAWWWLGAADAFFKGKGWRFFYADERTPDGGAMGKDVSPESHGKFYLKLAEGDVEELPFDVTFAEGEYKKF